MSTLQSDDLEQNSSIHLETDVSSITPAFFIILQNSSIHSETDVSSSTSGEQLCEIEQSSPTPHEESGTPNMSTMQSDLEQNSSIHSETDVSSMTSALCIISQNSSIHSETDVTSMTSGEQLCELEQSSPTPHEKSGEEEGWKGNLLHAICVDCWNDAKAILDQNPQAKEAKISDNDRTALHVAAMFGHVTIVKELLKSLSPEFLVTTDSEGFTALALVCQYNGNAQVAECLVNKNGDLLGIEMKGGDLPVAQAIKLHFIELGRYLYSVTPLEYLTSNHGSKLVHYCFKAQCLDIALHLLQRCEELLLVPKEKEGNWTPIHDIASLNTVILSPSKLVFWKRWIYNYINKPSAIAINQVCVDIQQQHRSQEDKAKLITQPGVEQIQELKQQHAQADDLLDLVCKNARKAYQKGVIYDVLRIAAENGNSKFVFQVSKKIPEIFVSRNFFTFFSKALDNRHADVFSLIHALRFKNNVLNSMSADEDTMLHRAAIKAPVHILNRIYAPTLQMQNELQWYKKVESLIPPKRRGFRNKRGKTGEELFREEHRDLMKEGEKWIKKTATSCSVVGALIMTMMFAAAFNVPGGKDQNLGYPLLINQPAFRVFILSNILSLLSSATSVLMFLAILTSRYSEDQFLESLPTKLIFGLSFLFVSIVCMMIAFLSAIDLMLKHTHYSWILPIIILASVPIFLFVRSQFPLLLHTYVSTYGEIFDRKVMKPWP
ncbi:hypothetical protein K1719_036532 [Acacia pycnantha]|nr:hypothetical protein K1719_036532 [Acacia pycnantha]